MSTRPNGRLSGLLCWPHRQNGLYTVQIKNIDGCFGRLSGLLCWPHGRKTETSPAQQDSGISNFRTMGLIGLMGPIGRMGRKPMINNSPAQRDSGMSILKTSPTGQLAVRLVPQSGDPYRPLVFKTTPAQQDSKISNLFFPLCASAFKTVQLDSGISKLAGGPTSPTSPTSQTDPQCAPAQAASGISNLGASQTESQCAPAQADSGISNLKQTLWE